MHALRTLVTALLHQLHERLDPRRVGAELAVEQREGVLLVQHLRHALQAAQSAGL